MQAPSSGQLTVNGVSLSRLFTTQITQHRRQICSVFQDHLLLLDRSVYDNVALPLEIRGYRRMMLPGVLGRSRQS